MSGFFLSVGFVAGSVIYWAQARAVGVRVREDPAT